MLLIDGSVGEGGGQALRSSLALSLVTGQPFRIEKIRARRPRPGLMRQHLTAVQAAAAVGRAAVKGAELGSQALEFVPSGLALGEHRFVIGSAGSATLVLQTVLPALLVGSEPSSVVVEGGTHNPLAPPFEFLQRAYLPLLGRMGAVVTATLERHGFYPSGGGTRAAGGDAGGAAAAVAAGRARRGGGAAGAGAVLGAAVRRGAARAGDGAGAARLDGGGVSAAAGA